MWTELALKLFACEANHVLFLVRVACKNRASEASSLRVFFTSLRMEDISSALAAD